MSLPIRVECDKLVCDKQDLILKKNRDKNNIFTLEFEVKNQHMVLRKLIDLKLYDLMFELNKDVLERVETLHQSEDGSINVLLVFKRFGSELGIAQKYMLLRTTREEDPQSGTIRILSKSIPSSRTIDGCEVVTSNYADLIVLFHTEHHAKIHYEFHMDMEDELPTYMENIVGMLMKKIFFRLKTFIEKMH
tara:strand:+ start:4195 stop:4767 length:573 start_codon:yes stop_codon:yes gene_type:complete